MKILITMALLFTSIVAVQAQADKLIGKWNILEMEIGENTITLDMLKKDGKGKENDYLDFQKDGKMVSFDDSAEHLGEWSLSEDGKKMPVTLHPNEAEKAMGAGDATMTYDVAEMTDEHLVLKLGTYSTIKYTRVKE